MKYINKEYGFELRPPFYNDFSRISTKGPKIDNINRKPVVGAGLDSKVPYGAMLVGSNGSSWGIEFNYNIHGRWVGARSATRDIGRLYTSSNNGDFTYFANGDMTTAIMKYSSSALVFSIATMDRMKLKVKFNLLPPCEGELIIKDNVIKGYSKHLHIIPGEVSLDKQLSVFRNRYAVVGEDDSREYFTAKVYKKPLNIKRDNNSITYEYELYGKKSRLFIYARVGSSDITKYYPDEEELINGTSMEEIAYSTDKTIGKGILGRNIIGFNNSCNYNRIFNPFTHSKFTVKLEIR